MSETKDANNNISFVGMSKAPKQNPMNIPSHYHSFALAPEEC